MRKSFLWSVVYVVVFSLVACDSFGAKLTGVKGKVVDALTGVPVANAVIVATTQTHQENEQKYRQITTKSSQDGSFTLKGLPGRSYSLDITKEGYLHGKIGSCCSSYGYGGVQTPNESNTLLDSPFRLYPKPKRYTPSQHTVLDPQTGVMWISKPVFLGRHRDTPQPGEITDILTDYNRNKFAGYDNWRLPDPNELRDLINYHQRFISDPSGSNTMLSMIALFSLSGFDLNDLFNQSCDFTTVANGKVIEFRASERMGAYENSDFHDGNVFLVRNSK